MKKPFISVVTPVFRTVDSINELCYRLTIVLSSLTTEYEIILVNDASPDYAWEVITKLASEDSRIKGINLSRNFGQHYAITAGLDHAQGDWIVVMDCDLQHLPEEIPKLFNKAQEGYDLVVGLRAQRKDSYLKKLASFLFYSVFNYFAGTNISNKLSNFGIYSKKVIHSINSLRENNRSFGLHAIWVGFKRFEINIEHAKRTYGNSAYDFSRMFSLATDSVLSHSDALLKITIKLGLYISISAFIYAAWITARYFLWSTSVEGWTSVIVSIFFTSGLIIGAIGIVGLYVGKIFNEVKRRPLYLIDSTTFSKAVKTEMHKC
jgi:glycosyltransferase involved in cell wall biosynthesis